MHINLGEKQTAKRSPRQHRKERNSFEPKPRAYDRLCLNVETGDQGTLKDTYKVDKVMDKTMRGLKQVRALVQKVAIKEREQEHLHEHFNERKCKHFDR